MPSPQRARILKRFTPQQTQVFRERRRGAQLARFPPDNSARHGFSIEVSVAMADSGLGELEGLLTRMRAFSIAERNMTAALTEFRVARQQSTLPVVLSSPPPSSPPPADDASLRLLTAWAATIGATPLLTALLCACALLSLLWCQRREIAAERGPKRSRD